MRFKSGKDFLNSRSKAITVFGMSGVGKTTAARILHDANWFQYSVDYRIGTRYMDEHIADNFKREAMRNKFLRDLLLSDSIYIRSNITFGNLAPLSTYLGKPGDPEKGGIPFVEYVRRQAEHREAEIKALLDVPEFIRRSRVIYNYEHFVCDSGGSLCEVVDVNDPNDLVLKSLSESTLLLYVEASPEYLTTLVDRFRQNPKPMYYNPQFLSEKWDAYKRGRKIVDDNTVNPDDFAAWGFEQLVYHRIPRYEAIADRLGYRMEMKDIPSIKSEADFMLHISKLIDQQNSGS